MKKTILAFALTLVTITGFSQAKKQEPVNKDSATTKPIATADSPLTITMTVTQWQTILTALGEMPQKVANPIVNTIAYYFEQVYLVPKK